MTNAPPNITLDTESQRRARAFLAYTQQGPEHLDGLVHDALLTGLLSTGTEPQIREAVLEHDTLTLDGAEVALQLHPRAEGDPRPRAELRALGIAAALGITSERLPVVYLAAVRVGFRMLTRYTPGVSSQ